jgi:hypothetical protein
MNKLTLEARARRLAKRVGLRAAKSRDRSQHLNNKGGFMLVDPLYNTVINGADYDMTAEQVIAWCEAAPRAVPYGGGCDTLVRHRLALLHPSRRVA